MDLTELRASIRSYAENDFPNTIGSDGLSSTEQLDTFIVQAEQRIYNSVNLLELRKNVTGTCTANNKYLGTPADWLANYSLAVIGTDGSYEYLLNKDVSYIRAAYPDPTDTGMPAYYAMFDENTYLLGPTPDQGYTFELHYFYYPESITTANTSWLGDNFSEVLLYGSLLEAYTFMKGEQDVMAQYQRRYDEAMGNLLRLGEGMNTRDQYRSGQERIPPRGKMGAV